MGSQTRWAGYRDCGTLDTLSIPFGCHQLAKMLKKKKKDAGIGEPKGVGGRKQLVEAKVGCLRLEMVGRVGRH